MCVAAGVRLCWRAISLATTVGVRDGAGPGCLQEWRQDREGGGWQGRVVYAVDDGAATVMVEAWVAARHLQPAGWSAAPPAAPA